MSTSAHHGDSRTPPEDRLYFGCWGSGAGHYLHDSHGRVLMFDRQKRRWPVVNSEKLDGSFTPKGDHKHGAAKVWHAAGWTILAFHDYSRDSRGGSNAAFIFRGLWTAADVLAEARRLPAFAQQLEYIEAMGPVHVVEEHATAEASP